MEEKLAKMNIIKRRINGFGTLAVLALGSILVISIAPKCARGDEIDPFETYNEMYDVCMNNIRDVKWKESSVGVNKILSDYMVTNVEDNNEKLLKVKNDLLVHLTCIRFIMKREDLKNFENFMKVQLYTKYLTLYFFNRVVAIRENLSIQKKLPVDDLNRLYGPDVRLLLTFLDVYGRKTPTVEPIYSDTIPSIRTDGGNIGDAPVQHFSYIEMQDYVTGYRGIELAAMKKPKYRREQSDHYKEVMEKKKRQDIQIYKAEMGEKERENIESYKADLEKKYGQFIDSYKEDEERAHMKWFNKEMENVDNSFKKLDSFFSEILSESYIPPKPFTDLEKEYKYVMTIIDSNVMDCEIKTGESRLISTIKAMVKITQESVKGEATTSGT